MKAKLLIEAAKEAAIAHIKERIRSHCDFHHYDFHFNDEDMRFTKGGHEISYAKESESIIDELEYVLSECDWRMPDFYYINGKWE